MERRAAMGRTGHLMPQSREPDLLQPRGSFLARLLKGRAKAAQL